jgi:hypothetical protein
MSGFITGLLNFSLIFILGLTVLIERGQQHEMYNQNASDKVSGVLPEDILSASEPQDYLLPESENIDQHSDVSLNLLQDIIVVGDFIEIWLRRLSLEIYEAITGEPRFAQRPLTSNLLPEPVVQAAGGQRGTPEARLHLPLRISAENEPIVTESL